MLSIGEDEAEAQTTQDPPNDQRYYDMQSSQSVRSLPVANTSYPYRSEDHENDRDGEAQSVPGEYVYRTTSDNHESDRTMLSIGEDEAEAQTTQDPPNDQRYYDMQSSQSVRSLPVAN